MSPAVDRSQPAVRLGLRENAAQFSLLVLVNAFVGGMVGMERSILPALAEQEFQLAARTAVLSFDRIGRKWLIVGGMWTQAVGIAVIVLSTEFPGFAAGTCLLGLGTAMVYPTLLAAIGDVAAPSWRASAIGVYRFWRDLGYAVGALLAGICADALGLASAMWIIATLTWISGLVVAYRMREAWRSRIRI